MLETEFSEQNKEVEKSTSFYYCIKNIFVLRLIYEQSFIYDRSML